MKKTVMLAAAFFFAASPCLADTVKVPVNKVSPDGIGEEIGSVTFVDVPDGMDILVDIAALPPGEHGMHIHVNPSCEPAMQDGKSVAALAAGGHWDPDETKAHKGPGHEGHKGDLPFITANANGAAQQQLSVKGIATKDIKGRSIMIHAGGDNYSDNPAPLGGGGARIACGVIK